MLREILRDNLDELFLTIQKIKRAFDLIQGQNIEPSDIREIKRLVHSLKGNLQSIGMNDEAIIAIELEEEIFRFLNHAIESTLYVGKQDVDDWTTRLNAIEFSLKGYLF
jgi:chemotaxis protein histidine kinase CheA